MNIFWELYIIFKKWFDYKRVQMVKGFLNEGYIHNIEMYYYICIHICGHVNELVIYMYYSIITKFLFIFVGKIMN